MTDAIAADGGRRSRWRRFPPLGGRVADPAEVADLVLYLVSDASRYVTGTEVVIDAGGTLLRG